MLMRGTLMSRFGVVAILAVAWGTSVEAAAPPSPDFYVEFRFVDGHSGTWSYEVSPTGLSVSFEDLAGQSRERLCNAPLSSRQVAEWLRVVSRVPLDKLPSEYVGPMDDEDGVPFHFKISIRNADAASRTITAVPRPPPELADLCNRVMALVPEGCGWGLAGYCEQAK